MFLLLKYRNYRVVWHTEIHMKKLWQMPKRLFIYGLIQLKNLAILYRTIYFTESEEITEDRYLLLLGKLLLFCEILQQFHQFLNIRSNTSLLTKLLIEFERYISKRLEGVKCHAKRGEYKLLNSRTKLNSKISTDRMDKDQMFVGSWAQRFKILYL